MLERTRNAKTANLWLFLLFAGGGYFYNAFYLIG